MSIVRRWQAGAETGSWEEFSNRNFNADVSTAQKKTGSYSFIDGDTARYFYQTISATRQIRVGFYNYGNTGIETIRFAARDSGGTRMVCLDFKTDGSIALEIPDGTQKDIESGMNSAEWKHIGIDMKIDSSSGWAYVYKDGTLVMSFDGNTGNADIVNCLFGHFTGNGDYPCYYDDLYIDDTTGEGSPSPPPILRFYSVTPNANGNYSQWLGSDGDSTNNYLLVDEVPASDSDYVLVTGTNKLDSYNMTTFTLGTGEYIEAIIPTVRTKRTSTTEQISMGTRLSSTDLLGTAQNPSTLFKYLFERLTGTPSGADWQQSDLDSVELLIASTGTY